MPIYLDKAIALLVSDDIKKFAETYDIFTSVLRQRGLVQTNLRMSNMEQVSMFRAWFEARGNMMIPFGLCKNEAAEKDLDAIFKVTNKQTQRALTDEKKMSKDHRCFGPRCNTCATHNSPWTKKKKNGII